MADLDDDQLALALDRYVEHHVAARDPSGVAQSVVMEARRQQRASLMRRAPFRLAAAVLVVLLVATGAAIFFGTQLSSRGTTASVGGLQYDVGVARSLQVTAADLIPYGAVSSYTDPGAYPFADDTAYALRGVDPRVALVVRWAAGLSDDIGPFGDFALLSRAFAPEIPGLCAYFDPKSEATPPECP